MDAPRRRQRRAERLASRSAVQSTLFGVASSAGTLGLQLLTGVLTARLLGPSGRGEIESVISWVFLAAVVAGLGFSSGLSYWQARAARPLGSVFATGLVSVFVLGTFGFLVTQLLIPYGFAEQRAEVVELARYSMLGVYVFMGVFLVRALLGANNFFLASSINWIMQPAIYAAGAVALWAWGGFTVPAMTTLQLLSWAGAFVAGVVVLYLTCGFARPSRSDVRSAASFGLRGYPAELSRLATVRLDVVILPAFVVADQIGLYVVAVSVGSMMIALFEQVGRVVFTNTVRRPDAERLDLVERFLRVVLYGAAAIAGVLALIGPTLITWIYGQDFAGSATPLRWLLPGLVMWAVNLVTSSALRAFGRPGRSSLSQMIGVVVTVIGLLYALPRHGIVGAAVVSTIAYSAVTVTDVAFLRYFERLSVARVLAPALAVRDARRLLLRARAMLRSS